MEGVPGVMPNFAVPRHYRGGGGVIVIIANSGSFLARGTWTVAPALSSQTQRPVATLAQVVLRRLLGKFLEDSSGVC